MSEVTMKTTTIKHLVLWKAYKCNRRVIYGKRTYQRRTDSIIKE